MYDYVDRTIGSLDEGSRFLTWSMRGWVHSMAASRCPPHALSGAFAKSDMLAALPHFHMAMMALNRDGLDNYHFAPLTCERVSEDEAILLALIRTIAQGETDATKETLGLLVENDAVPILGKGLYEVATRVAARFPDYAPVA